MASFMVFILETSNKDDITLEQRLTQASHKKWLEIYVRRYTSKNKYPEIYPPCLLFKSWSTKPTWNGKKICIQVPWFTVPASASWTGIGNRHVKWGRRSKQGSFSTERPAADQCQAERKKRQPTVSQSWVDLDRLGSTFLADAQPPIYTNHIS